MTDTTAINITLVILTCAAVLFKINNIKLIEHNPIFFVVGGLSIILLTYYLLGSIIYETGYWGLIPVFFLTRIGTNKGQ